MSRTNYSIDSLMNSADLKLALHRMKNHQRSMLRRSLTVVKSFNPSMILMHPMDIKVQDTVFTSLRPVTT